MYKRTLSKFARIGAWKTGLRFAFFGAALFAFVACSDSPEKADERLVAAFVEMRVAEQVYGGETPFSRIARRDILTKYGYSREEFIKSVDKVLDDERRWLVFQVAVTDRIDSLLGIPKPKPEKKGKK
ncbi:hypothetical protein [Fibrobacter sp.]|uniref:hypothetical protein n=1 Tax=Fibrobacter sp. TaxID=35828 RepID=UPI0025BC210B|nr:hypothetical protein [Fibrobacter sp.]MBR3070757.1 hypothetical protein [Fibrobacter sp.]